MSSNWTDHLSQQMEHHEVEAPDGLWEGIEQGLDARRHARRAKLVWPWRAVAAAAAVAGVVIGAQLGQDEQNDELAQVEPQHPAALEKEDGLSQRENTGDPDVAKPIACAEASASASSGKAMAYLGANVSSSEPGVPSLESSASPSTPITPSSEPGAKPSEQSVSTSEPSAQPSVVLGDASPGAPPVPSAKNEQQSNQDTYAIPSQPQREGRIVRTKRRTVPPPVSLQLMAMTTRLSPSATYDADAPLVNGGYLSASDTITLESPRREALAGPARAHAVIDDSPLYSDHDFPVKFGAMVRVPLNRRFAFDVGLSYACLRSDLNFTTQSGERKVGGTQRVNYLGVPVALTGDLWTNRRWLLYASAGGEVAKSVKTLWRDWDGREYRGSARPWQCSVSAAVGLQLNLSRHVGLYAQPSVDYYFDNHSSVQTYYTEHPFTPALRMGVRVKL